MRKVLLLTASHLVVFAIGFGAGIYVLPILIAPPAPSTAEITAATGAAEYTAEFRRDLAGSDRLHWGEGTIKIARTAVALQGRLAPGPDYKLYLTPEFVQTKEEFLRLRPQALRIGDVKTFENFLVPVPAGTDFTRYNTIVVWCETFSQFITAAKYR